MEINEEYEKLAIERKIEFALPSPVQYMTGGGKSFLEIGSRVYISDFTEEGKKVFLQEYKDDWKLSE